jgi:hypothetical protein
MEHTSEQAAEGSVLVKVLAAVLERLVNSNSALARSDPGQVTKFHALKAPGIAVEQYLERYECCILGCESHHYLSIRKDSPDFFPPFLT